MRRAWLVHILFISRTLDPTSLLMGMSDSDSSAILTFAEWFSELPGRNIFAQVPYEFFEDDFNTYGWDGLGKFENGLAMILDDDPPRSHSLQSSDVRAAIFAYEAIHQRYITTKHGLEAMVRTFMDAKLGYAASRIERDVFAECNGGPVSAGLL